MALTAEFASPRSSFSCAANGNHSDADAEGYSPIGIATINGSRVAVYALQNGAKLDDAAGEGHGFADVFDSAGHLIRRFSFRESQPPAANHRICSPAGALS